MSQVNNRLHSKLCVQVRNVVLLSFETTIIILTFCLPMRSQVAHAPLRLTHLLKRCRTVLTQG